MPPSRENCEKKADSKTYKGKEANEKAHVLTNFVTSPDVLGREHKVESAAPDVEEFEKGNCVEGKAASVRLQAEENSCDEP